MTHHWSGDSMSVRDLATVLLALTEQFLGDSQAIEKTYMQDVTKLLGRPPQRADRRADHWAQRLRLRQAADELEAALDAGASDPVLTARLDAVLDASAFLGDPVIADLRAKVAKRFGGGSE